MKHFFCTLRQRADLILENSTATKDRPWGFQMLVVALFAVDIVAVVALCVIKIISL
jgi:hypothetical protein